MYRMGKRIHIYAIYCKKIKLKVLSNYI